MFWIVFGVVLTIDSTYVYDPFAPHLMLTVLVLAQQLGSSGQTLIVQHGLPFDMSVRKKQASVPGVTFPIFTVMDVD